MLAAPGAAPGAAHTSTSGREACHAARDALFDACDPLSPPPPGSACAPLRAAYEAACLASWRAYWEERVRRGRPILGRAAPPPRAGGA